MNVGNWLGLATGGAAPFLASFCCLAVSRIPNGEPVVLGRSRCDSCAHTLSFLELAPIASFALLKGRCRYCAASIPFRYPAAEFISLAAFLPVAIYAPPSSLLAGFPLGWLLFVLACWDFQHGRLPNVLTLPLLALGPCIAPLVHDSIVDSLIGAFAGFAGLSCIAVLYKFVRGQDGLGGGDVKLLAAAGAWVGWQSLFVVLLIASVSGLLFALMTGRRTGAAVLPFGPFIAAGTWAVWCWEISNVGVAN